MKNQNGVERRPTERFAVHKGSPEFDNQGMTEQVWRRRGRMQINSRMLWSGLLSRFIECWARDC